MRELLEHRDAHPRADHHLPLVPGERNVVKRAADWQSDPRLWEPHADGYGHRRAVEASARKYGSALGGSFLWILAARLTVVDVDRSGARPTPRQAWVMVNQWAAEGPRARRTSP